MDAKQEPFLLSTSPNPSVLPGQCPPYLLGACCSWQLGSSLSPLREAGLQLLGGRGRGGERGQLFILPPPPHSLQLTLSMTVKGPREAGVRQRGAGSCLMKSAQASCSPIRISDPRGAPWILAHLHTASAPGSESQTRPPLAGDRRHLYPRPVPASDPSHLDTTTAGPPCSSRLPSPAHLCPRAGGIFLEHISDCVLRPPSEAPRMSAGAPPAFHTQLSQVGDLLKCTHIRSEIFWVWSGAQETLFRKSPSGARVRGPGPGSVRMLTWLNALRTQGYKGEPGLPEPGQGVFVKGGGKTGFQLAVF